MATQSETGGQVLSAWVRVYTLKFHRTTYDLICVETSDGKTSTINSSGTYQYEEPTLTLIHENNLQLTIVVQGNTFKSQGLTFIKQ